MAIPISDSTVISVDDDITLHVLRDLAALCLTWF